MVIDNKYGGKLQEECFEVDLIVVVLSLHTEKSAGKCFHFLDSLIILSDGELDFCRCGEMFSNSLVSPS